MKIQAAPISLAGNQFVVTVAGMDLVESPGEADMAIEQLQARFGVPIVLMAQKEDGTPVYYGCQDLVELLRGVPVEQMPWQEHNA